MHITTRHIGIWLATVFLSVSALAQAALPTTEGEVRRVDTRAQTITLKHGEIKNLDMPPMTMVFTVADPGLLGNLNVGDKIRFVVEQQNGKMVVTHIAPRS